MALILLSIHEDSIKTRFPPKLASKDHWEHMRCVLHLAPATLLLTCKGQEAATCSLCGWPWQKCSGRCPLCCLLVANCCLLGVRNSVLIWAMQQSRNGRSECANLPGYSTAAAAVFRRSVLHISVSWRPSTPSMLAVGACCSCRRSDVQQWTFRSPAPLLVEQIAAHSYAAAFAAFQRITPL